MASDNRAFLVAVAITVAVSGSFVAFGLHLGRGLEFSLLVGLVGSAVVWLFMATIFGMPEEKYV